MSIIDRIIRKIQLNRIKGFKKIDGFLSDNEAFALYNLSKALGDNKDILEIGSWKGKSTLCLAKGLTKGFVFAIDPFNAEGDIESKDAYINKIGDVSLLEQFEHNLRKNNVFEKIKICQGYSADFINLANQFSLIFIDGDHSIEGCEFDFLNYNNKILKSGYIAFHDYYPDRLELGPTYVVNKYIKDNKNWKIIYIIDSLLVAEKMN